MTETVFKWRPLKWKSAKKPFEFSQPLYDQHIFDGSLIQMKQKESVNALTV